MLVRSALLTLFACLLLAVPARAQQSDDVLWYNTSNLAFAITSLSFHAMAAGATNVVDTDVWPADLSPYRLIFLVLPDDPFTTAQTADIQAFVDRGGLLVTVADNDNYDDEIDRLNLLLADLGISSTHIYGMHDLTCPQPATIVAGHPFVTGVGSVHYAASSGLTVSGAGVTLATGVSGQTLLAYEDGVVLSADSSIFQDWCPNQPGSDTLITNMFTLWCDMDGDGSDKAICGGGDCDDGDATLNPSQPEVPDGLDNDCNGLVDDGILPAGAVVVTEVMKDPSAVGDTAGEWFELHNTTVDELNLVGLVVSDLAGNDFTVDADLVLAAGGYAVLGRNGDTTSNGGVALDFEYGSFGLTNTGDEIILVHGTTELDRVEYDDVAWPDTPGASLSLDPAFADSASNDDPVYWCPGVAPYGAGDLGSPGLENHGCCDDDGDGYVDVACGGDDCDDGDAAVNPGAGEATCDGLDNDCAPGTLDEPDGDGDGSTVCDDCDDADAATNPSAAEVCDDGVDNDCDGAIDGLDPDCAGDDDDSGGDDDDVAPDDDDVAPNDDDVAPDDDDVAPDDDDVGPDDDDVGPDDDDTADDDDAVVDDDDAVVDDDDDAADDDDSSGGGDAADCGCAQAPADRAPAALLLPPLFGLALRRRRL